MPGWIGPWELLILMLVVLLVFGPKRLPEMGRSIGKGLREFKQSVSARDDDDDDVAELNAADEPVPAKPKRDTAG